MECKNEGAAASLVTDSVMFDLTDMIGALPRPGEAVDTSFGPLAAGELSCEERKRVASEQTWAAAGAGDVQCNVSNDCVLASNSSACFMSCGHVLSNEGAGELARSITFINSRVCQGYDEECGPLEPPPCITSGTPQCVAGVCKADGMETQ